MIDNNMDGSIILQRITAIILLVRLQNADIPYPHSKKCREQMCTYLTYLLTDEDNNDNYFLIKCDDIKNCIDDWKIAYDIIKKYTSL